jgi:predicted alpha-1,2-mannosidase
VRKVAIGLLVLATGCGDEPVESGPDPVAEVDVFIGTGGIGFGVGSIPPGPTHPYGLAKPGPETATNGGDPGFSHCAGYWWEDDEILSFAQIHLAGTGVPDYGVLRVMPALDLPERVRESDYRAELQHGAERAELGRYRVRLAPSGIDVEIAATPRTSLYRFSYPEGGRRELVVDLSRGIAQGETFDAELTVVDAKTLSGWIHHAGMLSGGFGGWRLYFELRFDRDFTIEWLEAGARSPASGTLTSAGAGAVLTFADGTTEVRTQIGLSFVDAATARANLDAEWVAFDLDRAVQETQAAWRPLLSRIEVKGGEPAAREMFYSALYHAQMMPTSLTETGGKYRGIDGEVRTADGFVYYSDFSLWDTFRTLHPLLTLVYPEYQRDMNASMEAMTIASGSVPKWPLATGESNTMIGYHGESVFVDSITKGVGGFDEDAMYATLEAAAMARQDSLRKRDCSAPYLERGWCGADEEGRSASKTLENAFSDFLLARYAEHLGEDAAPFDARADNWMKVFDADVGFVHGRNADGAFLPDFDDEAFSDDFVEGNARQWTMFVPHDPVGLDAAMSDGLVAWLSGIFEASAAAEPTLLPDLWYWHGNEPDIHAAYMFAEVGRPDLTAQWVDWIRRTRYTDGPDGLDGNDDGGTLSAWYVFSALGFYPKVGEARYVIGTPLFPEVVVRLGDATLTVRAENWAAGKYAVDKVTFDGVTVDGPYLDHTQLAAGGELVFHMAD